MSTPDEKHHCVLIGDLSLFEGDAPILINRGLLIRGQHYAGFSHWFHLPRRILGTDFCEPQFMLLCQNQWYHVGVGAPPILVYFSGIGMFTGGTGF